MPPLPVNATWKPHTKTGDYNTPFNWSGNEVPNGTATFGSANHHSLTFSEAATAVGGWTFKAGAPHYVFTLGEDQTLDFDGAGIKIAAGGATLKIDGANAEVDFETSASAGKAHFTVSDGGELSFAGRAGSAHINVDATSNLDFSSVGTAENATIVSNGAIAFTGSSNADHAKITVAGGGLVFDGTNAEHATITTEDGTTLFTGASSGGAAHFVTDADGVVDFSDSSAELFAGSIAGAGEYDLGGKTLTLTGNNSTVVTGHITDGGLAAGIGGSLDKQGTGKLTLDGENSYTGGTVLEQGTVKIGELWGAGTGHITFEDGKQTLQIKNEAMDTASPTDRFFDSNTIVSFGASDVIDLLDLKFKSHAKAVYDSGTGSLTVTSGKFTDTLTLSSPANTAFKVTSDGHGGSKITVAFPVAHEKSHADDHVASHDTGSTIDAETLSADHIGPDFIL